MAPHMLPSRCYSFLRLFGLFGLVVVIGSTLPANSLHRLVTGLRATPRPLAFANAGLQAQGLAARRKEAILAEAPQTPLRPRRWVLDLGFLLGLSSACAAVAAAGPIVVLGANGKTGRRCVQELLRRGERVVATSRTGELMDAGSCSSTQCDVRTADVTKPETLKAAVAGARGVIFAASQSKDGGSAKAVDNEGLVNTAEACIAANVKRLVVVSSGGVSRPDSPVYKFLNLFGNIMAEKIAGEDRVRALYASQSDPELGYTIVRPGGLTEDPERGASAVELGQGDNFSGRISRQDVASLSIAAVDSEAARNTTFECYYADTAKPLQSVGFSNILRQTSPVGDAAVVGRPAARGSSWEELLAGVVKDKPSA